MDVALTIQFLRPGSAYLGAFENNTEDEYNAITWIGPGLQPSWAEIFAGNDAALAEYNANLPEKLEDLLVRKGTITQSERDNLPDKKGR